jgi:hypothetical protein
MTIKAKLNHYVALLNYVREPQQVRVPVLNGIVMDSVDGSWNMVRIEGKFFYLSSSIGQPQKIL